MGNFGTIILIACIILYFILDFLNKNMTFIGKHGKLKIIMMLLFMDACALIVSILGFKICTNDIEYKAIILIISVIIPILSALFTISKFIKTIAEHKTEKSTLMNCRIISIPFGYKLYGDSLEGNKNTFILYGKDGIDMYRAMSNGINTFDITYFTSSKRIVKIALLPQGPVHQIYNMYKNIESENKPSLLSRILGK
ncbi:MAG: hypothetical protein J6A59_11730 [Lachnospiraceae bacterium]|nr:hypothetical protein [Lachnospiraceae bacterium]